MVNVCGLVIFRWICIRSINPNKGHMLWKKLHWETLWSSVIFSAAEDKMVTNKLFFFYSNFFNGKVRNNRWSLIKAFESCRKYFADFRAKTESSDVFIVQAKTIWWQCRYPCVSLGPCDERSWDRASGALYCSCKHNHGILWNSKVAREECSWRWSKGRWRPEDEIVIVLSGLKVSIFSIFL